MDLLLPRSDAGVLAQGIAVATIAAAIAYLGRRGAELLWLVGGVTVFMLGLFGLRVLH